VDQPTESHAKSAEVELMNKPSFLKTPEAEAIALYEAEHRHPNRAPFQIGPVVHLFPDTSLTVATEETSPWTAPWPFAERAGVYLIYSVDRQLLYIGKASMGQSVGKRLYCHFGGNVKECVYNQSGWKPPPRFVVIVAVPEDSPWEAPALEEFLISKLSPKLNVHGI
jgi:hypothetical protein